MKIINSKLKVIKIKVQPLTYVCRGANLKITISKFQCFGSGSGSMWIRIKKAPLDPDPYWEYGSGYGSRTVKMMSKKEKNLIFQVKKNIDHFAKGLMVELEPGIPQSMS